MNENEPSESEDRPKQGKIIKFATIQDPSYTEEDIDDEPLGLGGL